MALIGSSTILNLAFRDVRTKAAALIFGPTGVTVGAMTDTEYNRLFNEQAEVGILIAGPGAIATLAFALFVIMYSTQFGAAVEIVNWIYLGMTLRVVSWPMGYILNAKGMRNMFFLTEFVKT